MKTHARKRQRPGKVKPILGVGWYKETQWSLLLEHAVDKDDLEPTYAEWLETVLAGMENISKSGVKCEKIPVDVEEMIQWCKENGHPFDGSSRAAYITIKTKDIFG